MEPNSPTQFFYFDLGNVLLYFSHETAVRQIAEVTKIAKDSVREIVFDSGLQWDYERGMLSDDQFFEEFCIRAERRTGAGPRMDKRPDRGRFFHAGSAIFQLNVRVATIVFHLHIAGYRLGVLSNTCSAHWRYAVQRFGLLSAGLFEVTALSYELQWMKPDPEIYPRAAELASVDPHHVFFVDDREENVAAARQAGMDAVLYTTPARLVDDLRQRNVTLNY